MSQAAKSPADGRRGSVLPSIVHEGAHRGRRQSYLRLPERSARKSEPTISSSDRAALHQAAAPPPPPLNARPRALPPLESLDMTISDALAARDQWEETVRTEREVIRALENAPEQRSRRRSVSLGVVALGSGDYQTAIEHLTELIDGCGDDGSQRNTLLRLRAKAHRRAGALPAALHDSRSASQLHPSGANLQLHGALAASEGALSDAGHALHRAMALEPPGRVDTQYTSVLSGIRTQRAYFSAPRRRSLPRVLDPKVELSDPSRDAVAHMLLLPPQPPPPPTAVRVTYNSIELAWDLPDDDGGDEIYECVVECSYYDVAWAGREGGIFSGVREFERWHRGPAGVRTATWSNLEPDNMFAFRVRCANSIGYSDASPIATIHTLLPAERGDEGIALPTAWLESDYADLLRDQSEERGIDGAEVLAELKPLLKRYAEEIHVVFKLFCVLGSKDVMKSTSEMQRHQFRNLARDAELIDPTSLTGQQVDLTFQRANMDFRGGGGTAKAADEAGGVDSMVEDEFVNGLIRLAAARFGSKGAPFFPSLAERLEHMLEAHVLPAFRRAMPSQAVLAEIRSRRVKAILRKHDKQLRAVFSAYAAADISSVEAREAADMINLKELMFFAKEARLIDARFSLASLAYLFSAVNLENRLKSFEQLDADGIELKVVAKPVVGEAEEDAADDNEEELCFAEFRDILVRIASEKFPPDSAARGSRELAIAIDDWLEGQLLPLLTQCIKDKQRGVGQKHII